MTYAAVSYEERAKALRDAYLKGDTLQVIGDRHGLSRERVRQILKQSFQMNGKSGGCYSRTQKNRLAMTQLLTQEGLTIEEAKNRLGTRTAVLQPISTEKRRVLRFWRRVDRSGGPEACWPWTGGLDSNGYGRLSSSRATEYAHRFAYEQTVGTLPEALRHSCSNFACCNPSHLIPITRSEAGRVGGSRKSSRRTKEEQRARRAEIFRLRDKEHLTQVQIAAYLKTSPSNISQILSRAERRA